MSNQKNILLRINGLEINISQTDGKIILEIDPETKQVQQRKQGNQRKRKAEETLQNDSSKVQKTSEADVKTQTTERVTFSQPVKFPQLQLPPFAKQIFSKEMKVPTNAFSTYLKEQVTETTPTDETPKES